MLDIKFIRENFTKVKEGLRKKGVDFDIDYVIDLDEKRRNKIKEVDDMRAGQNAIADEIARMKSPEGRAEKIEESKATKVKLGDAEFELKAIEQEFSELMYKLPNLPLDDVPVGKDASENVVARKVGVLPEFDFEPKDHMALGVALDILDTEHAAKVTGARFAYFKREAVLLELALIQFTFATLTSGEKVKEIADSVADDYVSTPFIPVIPPVMIKPEVFRRMARLSDADKDERYYLPADDLYLVGSAEHTLGPLHMDETLDEAKLPIRYLGFSTSFRREAGSYGQDTKGVIRRHQFDKIEMESFGLPEHSIIEQDFFVACQEYLLKKLKIPYQVVMISTGDMGGPDARQIDIECWMPGEGKYRETHTADLMTDYQARRLNTKVRRKDGKTEFVHMNDATAFAIGRTLVAILENYQQEDGSVKIPDVLKQYMGGLEEIKR